MSLLLPQNMKMYFYFKPVDMRKSIDGLSMLVESTLKLNPLSGYLFLFRNKQNNKLKILFWQNGCFTVWYRRLNRGKFYFPKEAPAIAVLKSAQFQWLLQSPTCANMMINYDKNICAMG